MPDAMVRTSLAASGSPPAKKKAARGEASINSVGHDVLCTIFSLLGIFDLVRCSAVCKTWNKLIDQKELLQQSCRKFFGKLHHGVEISKKPWMYQLEKLVMEEQRLSLTQCPVAIYQWKGHSAGVSRCCMKMGKILTGVGDKVMRLWSVDSYKCLEEYSVPDTISLVDFDFDESKVLGLAGTQLCLWRRNGQRSIFPPRAGTFPKGLCLRYMDPEAVIGCEDGSIRVFDMYSKKCSRIMRMHLGPVTCLALSEDQFVFSGSSSGTIKVSHLSSDECITTLRTPDNTGIKTLCYNPHSGLVFAGSSTGYVSCFDFRSRRKIWERRASPSVIYSLDHMHKDDSTIVVGGIDGALHVLDQKTGEGLCSHVTDTTVPWTSTGSVQRGKGRRLSVDEYNSSIDSIPRSARPPITCLAVGMNKVVATQGNVVFGGNKGIMIYLFANKTKMNSDSNN